MCVHPFDFKSWSDPSVAPGCLSDNIWYISQHAHFVEWEVIMQLKANENDSFENI